MKQRRMIAAVDENNGLGYKGDLLFKIPNDLKRFKTLTTGNIVIMGRKTYESLGKPLPNRQNIIITSQHIVIPNNCNNVHVVDSIKAAYELAEHLEGDKVYVIGGGQIYAAALPWTQYIDLTEIFARADQVDTYFPDYHDFKALDAESHETEYGIKYRFVTCERVITVN